MKNSIKTIALALALGLSFSSWGQETAATQKIGHINADRLLQMMPETQAAQKQLEEYRDQLENDMDEMEKELESKIQKFRQNQEMMTNLSRETKSKEIQELQLRIQEYGMKAQDDLQNKQVELLNPIIDRATNAVQKVARANGFTYILDSSDSKAVVIFAEGGEDIMPMVKAELGLE